MDRKIEDLFSRSSKYSLTIFHLMLKDILQKRSKIEVHLSSKNTIKGRIHQQDKLPHTNAPTQLTTYNSSIPLAVLSPYYSVTRRSSVPSLQILDPSVIPSHHSILDIQIPPLQMSFSKDRPFYVSITQCYTLTCLFMLTN